MATVKLNPPARSDGANATKRRSGVATLAVHTSLESCDVLDYQEFALGAVKVPASVTSLTAYGAETADGSFVLIDDVGTNGTFTVVASKWVALPAGLAAYPFLKFVSAGATGNAVVVGKT